MSAYLNICQVKQFGLRRDTCKPPLKPKTQKPKKNHLWKRKWNGSPARGHVLLLIGMWVHKYSVLLCRSFHEQHRVANKTECRHFTKYIIRHGIWGLLHKKNSGHSATTPVLERKKQVVRWKLNSLTASDSYCLHHSQLKETLALMSISLNNEWQNTIYSTNKYWGKKGRDDNL